MKMKIKMKRMDSVLDKKKAIVFIFIFILIFILIGKNG